MLRIAAIRAEAAKIVGPCHREPRPKRCPSRRYIEKCRACQIMVRIVGLAIGTGRRVGQHAGFDGRVQGMRAAAKLVLATGDVPASEHARLIRWAASSLDNLTDGRRAAPDYNENTDDDEREHR